MRKLDGVFLAALSSLLASPFPVNAGKWFSYTDYPADLMESRQTAFQPVTQTLVDASGKIVGCRVETASNSPRVDALACAVILKRGRFEPARWTDGTPVPGIYRWPVLFMVWGDRLERHSDIELQVDQLPDRSKTPAYVRVAFASSAGGTITDCVAERPGTPRDKAPDPALVSLACKTVRSDWKPFNVLGPDGKPSRSVQNAIVKFTPRPPR